MRNFDNHSDTDREFDEFNNQTTNNHVGYNNYNSYDNNSNYNNNNNNSNSSKSVFKNICQNSVYDNDYNRSSKNFEEFYKHQKKENIKNTLLFIVLVLIVLGVFIASCFLANAGNFNVSDMAQENVRKIFALIVSGVFGLVGLAILLYPIINKRKKMKRCKYLVKATIVDFKHSYDSEGHSSLHPVYKFCYKGDIYTVTNDMSLILAKPEIGSQVDILINEDNPYDFYEEIKSFELFSICFGFLFVWGMFTCVISILLG